MDVRAVLVDVAVLGPYFTVATGPVADGWRPLRELYADPEPLSARLAAVRRALDCDERVAASIGFQGLAAQLVAAPYAAVVLHGVLPGLTADALYFRATSTGPWPLCCPDPTAGPAGSLAALLLREHLEPLVRAVRALAPVPSGVLWGNAASAVAAAKRLLVGDRPAAADRAAAVAQEVLTSGHLAGRGRLLPATGPDRNWTFRRHSCCLYHHVPGGGLCDDCVLPRGRRRRGSGGLA